MLTRLRSIVQEVNQEPDLGAALQNLVVHVKDAMSTECCSVYLANYDTRRLILRATDGLSPDSIGQASIGFSEGLIGFVGQREEPINVAMAKTHPRFKHLPEVKEESYNAFLGVPIIHQRKVLGVIAVQQKVSRVFNETEEAFIVTLSVQLAAVLAHAEIRALLQLDSYPKKPFSSGQIRCVPGSAGLAIGSAFVAHPVADFASVSLRKVIDVNNQRDTFYQAVLNTRKEFKSMAAQLQGHIPKDALEIFDVYQQMLSSASLGNDVNELIGDGWCAISALKIVIEKLVSQFEAMSDVCIQERATDIKDLGHRILSHLLEHNVKRKVMPEHAILFAEEVTASMLAEIPKEKLKGMVSVKGSSNSHAAIMARAMGIPAVLGLDDIPLLQLEGEQIIVDGYSGYILIDPPTDVLVQYQELIDEELALEQEVLQDKDLDSMTKDGVVASLMLNAGLGAGLEYAHSGKNDGIGLFRTEYLFMIKQTFPSEQEQFELYQQVLRQQKDKTVVMRILDIGGDKSLPYLPIVEDNPFLGWRGIRLTLDHPEIFLVQIRAMIRANIGLGNLHMMLPMISSVEEVEESIRLINQAFFEIRDEIKDELGNNQQEVIKPKIGIMIEVPSVLYLLEDLADKIDFCSVGSNDLTQYLLAVDRNNARVSRLYDYFHPAVLRALRDILNKTNGLSIPASICGELAGDPAGAVLLFAMGYRQLSMNANNLAKIKWMLRQLTMDECQQLLDKCEAMAILSNRANEYWGLIKTIFQIPLILTGSVMCILNSFDDNKGTMKIPNVIVNGLSVLLMSYQNQLKVAEKVEIFKSLSCCTSI